MKSVLVFLHYYRKADYYKGKVDDNTLRVTTSTVVVASFQLEEAPVFTDSKGGGLLLYSQLLLSFPSRERLAVLKAQPLALASSNSPIQLSPGNPHTPPGAALPTHSSPNPPQSPWPAAWWLLMA